MWSLQFSQLLPFLEESEAIECDVSHIEFAETHYGSCYTLACLQTRQHSGTLRLIRREWPQKLYARTFHEVFSIYYIDMNALPKNRQLVFSIRNYIWDTSEIFSISSLVKKSLTSFLTRKIFFSLEDKLHMLAPPCNILYLSCFYL